MNPTPVNHFFVADSPIVSFNWSARQNLPFRLAISKADGELQMVQVLEGEVGITLTWNHPVNAANAVSFLPTVATNHQDLLATTGDEYLRVWNLVDNNPVLSCMLRRPEDALANFTSLDWNQGNLQHIGVTSMDRKCKVFDVVTQNLVFQSMRHNRQVTDLAWGDPFLFASSSMDGFVRLFDVRAGDRSQLYHHAFESQFTSVSWSQENPSYIAAARMGSNQVVLVDFVNGRKVWLRGAHGPGVVVNAIDWDPIDVSQICTGCSDSNAMIWKVPQWEQLVENTHIPRPRKFLDADRAISTLKWSKLQPDWIALSYDDRLNLYRCRP